MSRGAGKGLIPDKLSFDPSSLARNASFVVVGWTVLQRPTPNALLKPTRVREVQQRRLSGRLCVRRKCGNVRRM